MQTIYENLGITEETSKAGKPYKALNIRKTTTNDQGVVVELFVTKAFPVKGVDYSKQGRLKMTVVTIAGRSGFIEPTDVQFVPEVTSAAPASK